MTTRQPRRVFRALKTGFVQIGWVAVLAGGCANNDDTPPAAIDIPACADVADVAATDRGCLTEDGTLRVETATTTTTTTAAPDPVRELLVEFWPNLDPDDADARTAADALGEVACEGAADDIDPAVLAAIVATGSDRGAVEAAELVDALLATYCPVFAE